MGKNVVNWFEIPVTDMARAKKFYTGVFQKPMEDYNVPGTEMAVFPYVMGGEHSPGCLEKSAGAKPSTTGTLIYFACDDLSAELSRVEQCGGKVLLPKTSIGENGFIAHIVDTEGNRVGLHSRK